MECKSNLKNMQMSIQRGVTIDDAPVLGNSNRSGVFVKKTSKRNSDE